MSIILPSWNITELFEFDIGLVFFGLLINIVIYYWSKTYNVDYIIKNYSTLTIIRFNLFLILLISTYLQFAIFWQHINYLSSINAFSSYKSMITGISITLTYFKFLNFFSFTINFFGVIFVLIAHVVGIISFLALDTRFYWKNVKFIFVCNLLIVVVVFFSATNDSLIFFLLYEALLIPSFLFVYSVGYVRRSTQAGLYFIIWTQVGSFLVLCFISYLIYSTGTTSIIDVKEHSFTKNELFWLYLFLFIGFGIKVPIWPFHFWLTKTHVEAPAGFSIFLSGFLVKSAVYGFYRLGFLLEGQFETIFVVTICTLSVLDASIKMWNQTDLKKLIAYGTIQEMNIIYLGFCWGDAVILIGGVLFCVTHALLSALFFYLVDCIQRRYNSRSTVDVSGILQTTPSLGVAILISVFLYGAFPGSLKFICELYIFSGLLDVDFTGAIVLIYTANFFGYIGFSKCWFNVVFGLKVKDLDKPTNELTWKEFLIIFFCISALFYLSFVLELIF